MKRRFKVEILGVKSQKEPSCPITQGLRTSSQFLQGSFPTIPSPKKLKLQSIGSDLGKTFAYVFQVYRQRVTHLKSDEGSGAKDEKEQRRECKAEFPSSDCCGDCAPTFGQTTQKTGLLLLNPVTNRQFLTLLNYIKRLHIIAEVPDKLPNTINYVYGSETNENKGNVSQVKLY